MSIASLFAYAVGVPAILFGGLWLMGGWFLPVAGVCVLLAALVRFDRSGAGRR